MHGHASNHPGSTRMGPPACSQDDQAATLREASLLSSLEHPNIIRYKECCIDKEGALCIVTSFCEEGELHKLIRERAKADAYFSENEVMNMFVQVRALPACIGRKAQGLQAARALQERSEKSSGPGERGGRVRKEGKG